MIEYFTAQKMKFSVKDFFSKCDKSAGTADLVTFTEEILSGKLHFLCSVWREKGMKTPNISLTTE